MRGSACSEASKHTGRVQTAVMGLLEHAVPRGEEGSGARAERLRCCLQRGTLGPWRARPTHAQALLAPARATAAGTRQSASHLGLAQQPVVLLPCEPEASCALPAPAGPPGGRNHGGDAGWAVGRKHAARLSRARGRGRVRLRCGCGCGCGGAVRGSHAARQGGWRGQEEGEAKEAEGEGARGQSEGSECSAPQPQGRRRPFPAASSQAPLEGGEGRGRCHGGDAPPRRRLEVL